ncbi:MAG TPA: HD domain-containing protein, partial [Armatimonadetes bacterium]|nr:HD domain-containing protein [Armatimonadota bacterium]
MSAEPDTALVELVEALERRETTGKGHSRAVARWAVTLAREVKLHSDHIAVIEKAGLLHDIGKIEVPSYVLNKPARLTAVEFESIKQHPLIGARIARALPSCRDAAVAIAHHHERWDGHGYPHGKRGRDIPTEGRILAVAEAF